MDALDLIRNSVLESGDSASFDKYRRSAIDEAARIWDDRAQSYNLESSPTDEMPYGVVSGVSEVYKRMKRLKSLVSPLRKAPYRQADLDRMLDTCIDMINYGSWLYALFLIAFEADSRLTQESFFAEMSVSGEESES